MKTDIKLFDDEEIIFECYPKKILAEYILLRKILVPALKIFLFVLVLASVVYFLFVTPSMLKSTKIIFEKLHPEQLEILMLSIILLFFIGIYGWIVTIISRHRYIFTSHRCIVFSGFMRISNKIIPYNCMTDISFMQSSLQKIFGLTSALISEQPTNISNPLFIHGLSMDDVDKVTEVLSEHITKKLASSPQRRMHART